MGRAGEEAGVHNLLHDDVAVGGGIGRAEEEAGVHDLPHDDVGGRRQGRPGQRGSWSA